MATFFFMPEQLPNPSSRVDLSDRRGCHGYRIARVNWQLDARNIADFAAASKLIMPGFKHHPQVSVMREDPLGDWITSVSSVAHHLGIARMATSPADGVADQNLKLFVMTNTRWQSHSTAGLHHKSSTM